MRKISNHPIPIYRLKSLSASTGTLLLLPLLLIAVWVNPCDAVDGQIKISNSYQEGQAGSEAFDSHTRIDEGIFRQKLTLPPVFTLQGQFFLKREIAESRSSGFSSEFENRTYQPSLMMSYSSKRVTLGMNSSRHRRETTGSTSEDPVQDRFEYGGHLSLHDLGGWKLGGRWATKDSQRELAGSLQSDVKETSGSVATEYALDWLGVFRYNYSNLENDARKRDVVTTHSSHNFMFDGIRVFADGRGDVSWNARTRLFTQTIEVEGSVARPLYQLPLAGGVRLDDTPEVSDPLEDELSSVVALFDRNRSASTVINLGDDASVVREFGGDYRNIQYDFGEEASIDSMVLFVDRTLLIPERYQWRIFVSNDPEASNWDELSGADFTIQYNEWSTGLQGWAVKLTAAISARFVKMVDVKIGSTVPDLFVTEFEVYSSDTEEVRDITKTEDDTQTNRLEGSVGYAITPKLRLRYNTTYRERLFSSDSRDLIERGNGLLSSAELGNFRLSGRWEVHTLSSPGRQNTDVTNLGLSIKRDFTREFVSTISWFRSKDRSGNLDKETDNYAFFMRWQAAPALRVDQRFSHGRLNDISVDDRSSSFAVVTTIWSNPTPKMGVELRRSDRWVDREGGGGFLEFNDTGLTFTWSPVRQIGIRSQVRYQERTESDWVVQHYLSWQPLPGGDVETRFSLNRFSDTRNDSSQEGAGMSVRWRVQPRVVVEGDIGSQRFEVAGESNSPVNGGFRATMTF